MIKSYVWQSLMSINKVRREEAFEDHNEDKTGGNFMTSHVLTLIGNADLAPLQPAHIKRVCQCLGITGKANWLAENEACDIAFVSPLPAADITRQALVALSGTAFDAVCTPLKGRRKKLLVADMDSTIINQECINELGDALGIGPRIREITAAVICGDISFSTALRQRMVLMKGMERTVLENVYKDRISLKQGARVFVQTMRHHGAWCILVSGGFTFFTRRIAGLLGFHDHQGNRLKFENEKLTGEVLEPILGQSAKLKTLLRLCDEKGLKPFEVLAVGDGANDIKMIEAAGLGIAIHGDESLRAAANARIDHGDLTSLLYIQGFRKSEFIIS